MNPARDKPAKRLEVMIHNVCIGYFCLFGVYIYFFLPTGTLNPHTYWGIHRTVCVSGHLMLILSCPDSHCIL